MPLGNRMLHLEMNYLLKSSSLALHRKGLFCIWVPQLNLHSLFLDILQCKLSSKRNSHSTSYMDLNKFYCKQNQIKVKRMAEKKKQRSNSIIFNNKTEKTSDY